MSSKCNALIGHSGFVGSHLQQQFQFTQFFNSKNYRDLTQQTFDLVVCAGISAVKWQANQNPTQDHANIQVLEHVLQTLRTKFFILISTIDIYGNPENQTEEVAHSQIPSHAYGANRLAFEKFVSTHFPNSLIVRLPALFGNGLKKNVLYDLMHSHQLEKINPNSSFQWYNVEGLWKDIEIAYNAGLKQINLVTEPIVTHQLLNAFFPKHIIGQNATPVASYNIKTSHADLYQGENGYIRSQAEVLKALGHYIHG